MVTNSGTEPGRPKSGDPHAAQKARLVVCPLSAVRAKYCGLPCVSVKAALGTARMGANALPVSR